MQPSNSTAKDEPGVPMHQNVAECFTPSVAVACDPDAQAAFSASGLSLVDVLRMCSKRASLGAQGFPFRVEKGTIRREGHFKVRFFEAHTLHTTPRSAVLGYLHTSLLPRALEKSQDLLDALSDGSLLAWGTSHGQESSFTPWLQRYVDELSRTLLFQSHEMVDHPVAAVYAISAHAVDTTAAARALLKPHLAGTKDDPSFSQAMRSQVVVPFWDSGFPRHFIIVVDARLGVVSQDVLKRKVEALSRGLPASIDAAVVKFSVLTVNSGPGDTSAPGAQMDWGVVRNTPLPFPGTAGVVPTAGEPLAYALAPPEGVQARGCWLSQRNLDDAVALVETVIRETVCTQMERRMGMLRDAVAPNRSSFIRSISKAIGFPSRSQARMLQNGHVGPDHGLHRHDSVESRLRQLGDLYFMIGQYRDAEVCYSDAEELFRPQRALRPVAGALEAMALARFMQMAVQGAEGLEVCKPFEDAFQLYLHLSPSGFASGDRTPPANASSVSATRGASSTATARIRHRQVSLLAMRCGVRYAAALMALHNNTDAFAALVRTAEVSDPVLSALLLQQAGLAQGRSKPAHPRKAALYFVIAGQRFHAQQMPQLAFICYAAATAQAGEPWRLLRRTIGEHGAATSHLVARWHDAARHLGIAFRAVDATELPATHAALLERLRRVVCQAEDVGQGPETGEQLLSLPLPHVESQDCTIHVLGEQVMVHIPDHGELGVEDDPAHWAVLEDAASLEGIQGAAHTHRRSASQPEAFAGEQVALRVSLRNPLAVTLSLRRLRLACRHEHAGRREAGPPGCVQGPPAGLSELCELAAESAECVTTEHVDIELAPGSVSTVTLHAAPQKPGQLCVLGLLWDLELHPAGQHWDTGRVPTGVGAGKAVKDVWTVSELAGAEDGLEGRTAHVGLASLLQPSGSIQRYPSQSASTAAGEHTRGMLISQASAIACKVAPPPCTFRSNQQLSMLVHPLVPLVLLRPATTIGSFLVPTVPQAFVESHLFPDWVAAGRLLDLPAVLLAGELAPLAFVVSRPAGTEVRSPLHLWTTNCDIALLPSLEGVCKPLDATEILGTLPSFGSTSATHLASLVDTKRQRTAAGAAFAFPLDVGAADWKLGPDGQEHLPLTVWLHPDHVGGLRIRLMLAYETPIGIRRTTHFAFALDVRPAIELGAAHAAPLSDTLSAWRLSLPLTAGPALVQQTGTSALNVSLIACRSEGWQAELLGLPTGDSCSGTPVAGPRTGTTSPATLPSAAQNTTRRPDVPGGAAMLPVDVTVGQQGMVLDLQLVPRPNVGMLAKTGDHDRVKMQLAWNLRTSSGHKRVGILALPVLCMEPLLAHQALRVKATIPDARPMSMHSMALCADSADEDCETVAVVEVWVRNCGVGSMSVYVECGDMAQRSLAASGNAPVIDTAASRGVAVAPPTALLLLSSCLRHRWLGAVRIHLPDIPAGGERCCRAKVALRGHGVFVLEDYVCSWHVTSVGARGKAISGPRIEVYVASPFCTRSGASEQR